MVKKLLVAAAVAVLPVIGVAVTSAPASAETSSTVDLSFGGGVLKPTVIDWH